MTELLLQRSLSDGAGFVPGRLLVLVDGERLLKLHTLEDDTSLLPAGVYVARHGWNFRYGTHLRVHHRDLRDVLSRMILAFTSDALVLEDDILVGPTRESVYDIYTPAPEYARRTMRLIGSFARKGTRLTIESA